MWLGVSALVLAVTTGKVALRHPSTTAAVQGRDNREGSAEPVMSIAVDAGGLERAIGVAAAANPLDTRAAPPSPVDDRASIGSPRGEPAGRNHSSSEAIARGRLLRSQGDIRGAEAAYRAAYAAAPGTTEGKKALVLLGELLLSDFGDPGGALAVFDRYLGHGGRDLARQAAYGRIRALRVLGRESEARAAARSFLGRYRTCAEADALRVELRLSREN
jgi:tetratricopeptide (TPR) repeat protein